MFYRRKLILALLDLFDGELDKIRLHKLLFLVTKKQDVPDYEFIPYKYGCFSYSANADLNTMVSKGMLAEEGSKVLKKDKTRYLKSLKADDLLALRKIKASYGRMGTNALMKHTYQNFPYWAIHSVKAKSLLTAEEFAAVERQRPNNDKTILFTIGYEGNSLENYLNRLIENDVRALVDVRNNPISMKFGFSKSQLRHYCESINVAYFHFPQVGITSEKRQELNSQADYDKLFAEYSKTNLPNTKETQNAIFNLLKQHKRIALTCFEAQSCQCHRRHLAEAIESLPGFEYEINHI